MCPNGKAAIQLFKPPSLHRNISTIAAIGFTQNTRTPPPPPRPKQEVHVDPIVINPSLLVGGVISRGVSLGLVGNHHLWKGEHPINKLGLINMGSTLEASGHCPRFLQAHQIHRQCPDSEGHRGWNQEKRWSPNLAILAEVITVPIHPKRVLDHGTHTYIYIYYI